MFHGTEGHIVTLGQAPALPKKKSTGMFAGLMDIAKTGFGAFMDVQKMKQQRDFQTAQIRASSRFGGGLPMFGGSPFGGQAFMPGGAGADWTIPLVIGGIVIVGGGVLMMGGKKKR